MVRFENPAMMPADPVSIDAISDLIGAAFAGSLAEQEPEVRITSRHVVHVIAASPTLRAKFARLIFARGHHAEVYSDVAELTEHIPHDGVVLVLEDNDCSGIAVTKALARHGVWLPILVYAEQIDADRIVGGIKAGVMDYMVGPVLDDLLLAKIARCATDGAAFRNSRARHVVARASIDSLSQREGEVLAFLTEGLSNKEIARELDISPRTVEIHRMKMMAKLGAKSSAHAIRLKLEAALLN